jgi:hypothetical protein
MSPGCLTGRYAGKGITLVNRSSPLLFVALIKRFQWFYAIAKRDRFEYLKRSLSIAHFMGSGDTCPKGTSNARHVATLAGLEPFQDQWVTACENGQATPTKELAADLPDGRLRLRPRR